MSSKQWTKRAIQVIAVLGCLALAGCASLMPNFERPEVKLTSFTPLPSDGLEQRFKVGLRVLNPNSVALPVQGLSYHLSLNGQKVVSGVSGDVPEIPAYGDVALTLEASVSLLSGARFILDLLQRDDGMIDYELQTKLDVGLLSPAIRVVEYGQLSLDR